MHAREWKNKHHRKSEIHYICEVSRHQWSGAYQNFSYQMVNVFLHLIPAISEKWISKFWLQKINDLGWEAGALSENQIKTDKQGKPEQNSFRGATIRCQSK